jgi:hypothetical protein
MFERTVEALAHRKRPGLRPAFPLGMLVVAILLTSCAVDAPSTTTTKSTIGKPCFVVGAKTKSQSGTFYCTPTGKDDKSWQTYFVYQRYETKASADKIEPTRDAVTTPDPGDERFLAAERAMNELAEEKPSSSGKMPSEYYAEWTGWCIDVMGAAIEYRSVKPVGALMPEIYYQCGGGRSDYENCSEARAAGADPVHRGESGFGGHLDRDSDGIGCE